MMPQEDSILRYFFRLAFSEYRVEPWTCASTISTGLHKHLSLGENTAYRYGLPNRFVFWIPPVVQIYKAMTNPNVTSDVFASALAGAIESSIFTIYTQSQIKIVDYPTGSLQIPFQQAFRNMVNTPDILAAILAGSCFNSFKQIYVTFKTPPPDPRVETGPLF